MINTAGYELRRTALVAEVPDAGGVYVLVDSLDAPFYVGQAANLRRRVRSHIKAWTYLLFVVIEDHAARILAERDLISRLAPSANTLHVTKERRHKQAPEVRSPEAPTDQVTEIAAGECNLLPGFFPIKALWERGTLYPSEQSARWALRQLRKPLVAAKAIALHRGQLFVHIERLNATVLEQATAAAAKRLERQL